ncbi:MAG: hypothetical protein J7623_01980 [Chitinophaga sp.]|uniref:hypothetical protein n=1 Tax=Chitinophaga sp. TaxID=1869181 RepID=UPI001B184882|nr:hypothetical protein [Chitinophaga sp.]MBO9727386.1 hypothetical protein [Chitinophaga sp.]
MKYLNPLDFLTVLHGGPVDLRDNNAVSLLRKKSLAELELADDKMLRVNGQLLSKNDLLLFFDRLQSSQELQYHQQIAADPVLSRFLQTGDMTAQIVDHPLYHDSAFLSFIAPYYEPMFTTGVVNSLKTQDVATLQYLFSSPLLLDGPHITISYRHVLRYLKALDNGLNAAIDTNRYKWKRFERFANATLITQLNILPAEFEKWRSDYGISLINLALAIYKTDLRRGQQVLTLVAQLRTTDFVQERLQVRKKELQAYKIKDRPLVDLLGSLTYRIRPYWLTDRNAGRLILALVGVAIITMGIRKMDSMPKSSPAARLRKEADLLANMRTRLPMNSLLGQLEQAMTARMGIDTTTPAPKTGDDVYGPDFMKKLTGLPYTPSFRLDEIKADEDTSIDPADASFSDSLHRQSLLLLNRLDVPMVALVQTPDSFYSRFIVAHDSIFLPLQTTANRIYFYIGQYWTRPLATQESHHIPLPGYFAASYKNANTFLRENALTFVLDPVYWRRSNRYIPVEIGADEQIYTNLLDNDASGVTLYLGN